VRCLRQDCAGAPGVMKGRRGPLAAAAAVLIADRGTKLWIDQNVSAWDVWPVIPGVLNIIHAENRGMAFSLLASAADPLRSIVLVVLASVVLALVGWMWWRSESEIERWALALVTGGAAGNLWDRVLRGSVTDFIDLYYRDWHWATFNIADSAITAGAILLGLQLLLAPKQEPARRVS